MTDNSFPEILTQLRQKANLSNRELAEIADVPRSLIAGLQSGRRRVGELQAKRIGSALELRGQDLEKFVLQAIDTCTEKLLDESTEYPATLLNWLPRQLRHKGILPSQLTGLSFEGGALKLLLQDGSITKLEAIFA